MSGKPVVNINELHLEFSSQGTRFAAATTEFGVTLGLHGLGAALYVVPPGRTATPFHRHHTSDELFFILSGSGEYRFGEERLPVKPGDCLGATGHHREDATFAAGGRLVPLGYWEGEDTGDGKS